MAVYDLIIIGAGVMGTTTACEAALLGARVAIIDQAALPNLRGASFDHSKVFRFAYPDPLYVRMAVDALARWRELEQETGAHLLTETGILLLSRARPSYESESYEALRSLGLRADMLDSREAAKLFPQFDRDAFAYALYDPSGAILHADRCLRALIDLARKRGVTIIEERRIVDVKQAEDQRTVQVVSQFGEAFEAASCVVASGPWTRKLLPSLEDKLFTTRQDLLYFTPDTARADFEIGRFPIFTALDSGFYGFPVHHNGAMKIANHNKGEPVDPYSIDDKVQENSVAECRAFFKEYIPALGNARFQEGRVCIYNNTADDDFIIDHHAEIENVLIATGFSGHGFKFGPTIGRIAAEMICTGHTAYPLDRFKLSRQEQ